MGALFERWNEEYRGELRGLSDLQLRDRNYGDVAAAVVGGVFLGIGLKARPFVEKVREEGGDDRGLGMINLGSRLLLLTGGYLVVSGVSDRHFVSSVQRERAAKNFSRLYMNDI